MTLLAVRVLAPVPPTETPTVPVVIADPLIPVVVAVVTTVPDVAGRVNTVVPATAGASSVTDPDVFPAITTDAIIYFLFVLFLEFYDYYATSTVSARRS
jgi:hypothetical protein